MAKINLDFSSSLSQIDQLKSSALGFNQVLQDILNTTAKFGNAINQATSGATSASLSNLKDLSSSSTGELLSSIRERMQANQQAIQDFHKSNPNAVSLGGGRYRVSGAAGTNIKNLQPLYEEQRQLKQEELQARKINQDINIIEKQSSLAQDIKNVAQSRMHSPALTGFGYDISGLPSLLSASERLGSAESGGDLKRLSDTIKSLQESGNRNSQIAADVLRDVTNNLRSAQLEFQNALQIYNDPAVKDDPKRQVEAMSRLTQAMENLDRNIDQAQQAERGARQLPGGGGGGSGGEGPSLFGIPMGRFIRGAGIAGSVVGGALGIARFAQDVSIGLGRGVVGGEIDKLMTQGQMAERRFGDVFASNDFTKIENMMRFRGDVLTAGQSRFLGSEGFGNALELTRQRQSLEIDLMKQERTRDLVSGSLGALGRGLAGAGAGAIAGSAIPVIGTALGALGGFAAGAFSAIPGLTSSYIQSPATQLEGLNQGLLGTAGSMFYGPGFKNLAIEKQQALMSKINLDNYNQARGLQDAEMQRFRPLMTGYQEVINTIQAQQEGVSLVGSYAVRGRNDLISSVSMYSPMALERAREFQRLQDAENEANKRYESDRRRAQSFSNVVANNTMASEKEHRAYMRDRAMNPEEIGSEEALRANAYRRDFESSPVSYRNRARLSVQASLEMSRSDFQRHQNQITNVLGFGQAASEEQTARLIRMSRSGLGDFNSLLGNLAGMNRAVGGVDNTRNLERVLENAISAGFDKSRMSQVFTQTAIQLSEQTGITGVDSVARSLRIGAAGMSATGVADERSLGLAAKGFSDFSAYTSQVGGVSGILGTVAAFQTGLGFGKGGGILMNMGSPELADAIKQLESGKITNPRVAALQRVSGQSNQELISSLREVMVSKNAPIETLIQNRTGRSLSEIISKVNSGNIREFQEAMAIAMEAGTQMDLGPEGAMSYVASIVNQSATPDMLSKLNEQIRKSQNLYKDPAKQNLQAFVDSLTANAMVQDRFGADGAITDEERKTYSRAVQMGMSPLTIQSGKFRGQEITEDRLQDPEFRAEADKELMKLSRFDIARQTQNAASLADSRIQQVMVVNASDIGFYTSAAFRAQENKDNFGSPK